MLLFLSACRFGHDYDVVTVGKRSPDAALADGAVVVAIASDGVYVQVDDAPSFTLLDATGTHANVYGGRIVVIDDDEHLRVYDASTRALVAETDIDCGSDPYGDPQWIGDAVWAADRVWTTCASNAGAGFVVGTDPTTGERTVGTAFGDTFDADGDDLYVIAQAGRDGAQVLRFDPSTGATDGGAMWAGNDVAVRFGARASTWGEQGNAAGGGLSIDAMDGSASFAGFELGDGVFPWAGADVLPGVVELVDVLADETESATLYDPDGAVLDTLDACLDPHLVWRDLGVDGWCVSPLRRTRWDADGGAWVRGDTVTVPIDAREIRVVDPGEGA